MDKLEVLKRSDLFRELNDEQLSSLAKICDAEVFEPGAIIHKQDEMLDKLHIIEEGLVAIILELGPLSKRQLQAATNFETFGWSAIIPPHISTATVKAIERTKVLSFHRQDIADLCSTNCMLGCIFYREVARVVADRLHAAYMQCLGVTAQD